MGETSTRSYQNFDPYGTKQAKEKTFGAKGSSPGKSVYMASERGSDRLNKSNVFGGYVSPLRALKGIKPYQ